VAAQWRALQEARTGKLVAAGTNYRCADPCRSPVSGVLASVEANGEVAALVRIINPMVDTLSAFADEVNPRLATSARRDGWATRPTSRSVVGLNQKDLTDNVNSMVNNLPSSVRNPARVTTVVAKGDLLAKMIDVDARGRILKLNTTVDRLSFGADVTQAVREVGGEGPLGGQVEVVSGN
jgi:hypothetical protein